MITDIELLTWLMTGELEVGLNNPETINFKGRSIKAYENGSHRGNPNRTRWSFGLRDNGRRRTIVRSKLVWMAGALRLVPEGFEIHHRDENRHNDAWNNLVMVTEDDHKKLDGRLTEESTAEFLGG